RDELAPSKRQPRVVEVCQIEEENLQGCDEGQLRGVWAKSQPGPRCRDYGNRADNDEQIPRKKQGHETRYVVAEYSQHVDRAAREQVRCQRSVRGCTY